MEVDEPDDRDVRARTHALCRVCVFVHSFTFEEEHDCGKDTRVVRVYG